ncbi:alkaline phosphatase [Methylomagnum ishizawai]|uniref:alkaline phosphatase n=1 Tax=Methylomagnum ishizawai TaxID=1760988 RepID=UPI001C33B87E|nr:alkaline phosphatase [Methylomagnum ishizawai]BBL77050.1 alkaline phosphatase [Methylomagnum ishizawai]
MKFRKSSMTLAVSAALLLGAQAADALSITRLTPPSQWFATHGASHGPMISRFVHGQRFDIQATVVPDAGQTIAEVRFLIDGKAVARIVPASAGRKSMVAADVLTTATPPVPNAVAASLRAQPSGPEGVHTLTAVATQSDGKTTTADGEFEVVKLKAMGPNKAKNIIIMLGDGMGASHRTAARIVLNGYAQGKANQKLNMDTFPNTAMIMTASLNSIITDSAPGMQNYVTGNKAQNNQEGVWPDDTKAAFDNPRVEYLSEYLARTQNKKLGIVTTADVFDATPAANAVHTANRGAGTGIVDQYLDDAGKTNLTVLMGGGRKWFLPNPSAMTSNAGAAFNGSARTTGTDYVLPTDIVTGWGAAPGALDPARNLIGDFTAAGWTYVPDRTALAAAGTPSKLLGLFSLSNMNIALDKVAGQRGTSTVVNDYGFPDQPMLDEMAQKALDVLDANSPDGFVLMVEAASIDKQAHQMDSSRWILEAIEFDRAVGVAKQYASTHPDTLVIVTADHECSGAVIIGASTKTDTDLQTAIAAGGTTALGTPALRDGTVGTYDSAKFPKYTIAADGYPTTTDVDYRLLVGYGANGDRYEDYRTRPQPTNDSQQPGNGVLPLSGYPRNNVADGGLGGTRPIQQADGFFVTGQVPGDQAVHTGGDIPLSAYGRGASLLGGTIDNTDVFFSLMQATLGVK